MRVPFLKLMRKFAVAFIFLLACSGVARSQWTRIGDGSGNPGTAPSAGPAAATTCVLLTDGSVMCQEDTNPCCSGVTATNWWRLTPDAFGNYESGTWSQLQSAPSGFGPLYYCSAVLPDGRVAVIGGEDNFTTANAELTLGYVFDPTANGGAGQWSAPISLGSTGWTRIGDSICAVQPDKTLILGDNVNGQIAKLDLGTLTLSLVNSPKLESTKADNNAEEGWTLLPDGTILTVDSSTQGDTNSEIYDPVAQTWSTAGSTGVSLPSNGGLKFGVDIGPQMLRPDGTVVVNGKPCRVVTRKDGPNTGASNSTTITTGQGGVSGSTTISPGGGNSSSVTVGSGSSSSGSHSSSAASSDCVIYRNEK